MKIGDILKQCPSKFKKINKKERLVENANLSFYDFENMMKHSSYIRHNRAIKQIK